MISTQHAPHSEMTTMNSTKAVVFDLGGVVVRIWQTWQGAVESCGIDIPLLQAPPMPLNDLECFDLYQSSTIGYDEYLRGLGHFLGCSVENAECVHLNILRDPYPGMEDLIALLNQNEIPTGCLSNTNAPHWNLMTGTDRYALIANLKMRMGSHEIGVSKPNPEAFRAYEREFGLQPSEILYFDDNRMNVVSARSIGWDAHLIDPEGDPAASIKAVLLDRKVIALNSATG